MPLVRNPLVYPGGASPGFDQNHLANQAAVPTLLSAVATAGGNFVNVLSGRVGTLTGSLGGIKGLIGPHSYATAAGDKVAFSLFPTSLFKCVTLACIIIPEVITGFHGYVGTSSANSGWRLQTGVGGGGATFVLTAGGVADVSSGINLVSGVPYFLAASADISVANFVVADLSTGRVTTATATSATGTAGNGTALAGAASFGPGAAEVACVMAACGTGTAGRLSRAQLAAWAAEPWSFWYPRRAVNQIAGAAAGFPWWAVDNNVGVIGTGTY